MPDEQGLRSFVSIAVRSPVVQDHALLWARINESTYRMLQAMKEADWPQQHINVLFGFWMNLGTHEWRHDASASARQALIVYQTTYRRWWQDTLGTTASFNLKHIDQEALVRIKAKITDQPFQATERHAKEACTVVSVP